MVKVSFLKLNNFYKILLNGECHLGNDDFGLERDFQQ